MIVTILDFEANKTIITEMVDSTANVEDAVNELLGHSSFYFMTSKDCNVFFQIPLTMENSHINIREKGKGVLFNADFKSLTETIKDVVLVAEALRTDIDAGNIEEDSDVMDYELYNNFSQKYQ